MMGPVNRQMAHSNTGELHNSVNGPVDFYGPFRKFDGSKDPLYAHQSKTNYIFEWLILLGPPKRQFWLNIYSSPKKWFEPIPTLSQI